MSVSESGVEETVLGWSRTLGSAHEPGPEISPDSPRPERARWEDVVLEGRFRDALARINPSIPAEGIEEAARQVLHLDLPGLVGKNREFLENVCDVVDVERRREGRIGVEKVRHLVCEGIEAPVRGGLAPGIACVEHEPPPKP